MKKSMNICRIWPAVRPVFCMLDKSETETNQ